MKTLILIILIIAAAFVLYRKYGKRITATTGRNTAGQDEQAAAASDQERIGLASNDGDPLRFVFMKLYPAGKCAVSTSGDARYRVHVHDALFEARQIHVEIDRDKFRQRMQALAVPEDVIEDYVAAIRVLDEISLQLES